MILRSQGRPFSTGIPLAASIVFLLLESGCTRGTRPGEPPDGSFDTVEFAGMGWGAAPGYHLAWAIQAGGPASSPPDCFDYAWSVDSTPGGDFFLAGFMAFGEAVFGAGTDGEIAYDTAQEGGPYLARYGDDGVPSWVSTIRGSAYEINDVVALKGGGALVAGRVDVNEFQPPVFGAGEPDEVALDVSCKEAPFLAAYREDGTLYWVSHGDGDGGYGGFHGLARTKNGDACVGGMYQGLLVLGDSDTQTVTFTAEQGVRNGLVARYSANGRLLWARDIRAPAVAHPQPVVALANGSCAVGVYFQNEALVSAGDGEPVLVEADGDWSYLVAVYDGNGELTWVQDIGVTEGTGAGLDLFAGNVMGALAVIGDDVVVAGQFSGSIRAGTEDEPELVSAGPSERDRGFYVARLRGADGSRLWTSVVLGETDQQRPYDNLSAMTVLPGGTVLVGGGFTGRKTFGAGEVRETELFSTRPDLDGFLAAYGGNGALLWAVRAVSSPTSANPITLQWGDWISSVSASDEGAILAAGQFLGTATFGTGPQDSVSIQSFGDFDVFVLRLDPDDVPPTR